MADYIKLQYGYEEGLDHIVDVAFFNQLPSREHLPPVREIYGPEGLSIEPAAPNEVTLGTVIISGTATAAVTALAAIIKSWLASRRTRIELSNGDRKLVYEGPGLTKEIAHISAELSKFVNVDDSKIRIHATKRKEPELPNSESV